MIERISETEFLINGKHIPTFEIEKECNPDAEFLDVFECVMNKMLGVKQDEKEEEAIQ